MADKDKIHIDPICGMEINEDNAAGKSHYQGNEYYFCSETCKERFDLDPAEYVTSPVPKN
jgi:Cu+-exporting ATPase